MSKSVSTVSFRFMAAIAQQLPELPEDVMLGWIDNKKALGKGLRKLFAPPAENQAESAAPPVLELVRSVDADAQESFQTNAFFVKKNQPDGIRFWLEDNLKKNFLEGAGKIELDVPATTLNVYRLSQRSPDAPIIAALGGKDSIRTCLAYMAKLICKQPKGEDGILLTNGWANIFYVLDDQGELWAVHCFWPSDYQGWYVEADSVSYPSGWHAGNRVFSPAILVA